MRFAVHSNVGRLEAPQAYYRIHGQNMSEAYCEKFTLSEYEPTRQEVSSS